MNYLIPLVLISSALLFYQLLRIVFYKERLIDRVKKYTNYQEHERDDTNKRDDGYRPGLRFLAKGLEKTGMFTKYKSDIREKLFRANILIKPEELMSMTIIISAFMVLLGTVFTNNILLGILFGIAGWTIPGTFLNKKLKKRTKAINSHLGDTIQIISNSLKAGHSFFQSIDTVGKEMKGPVAEEFIKLQKEINLGVATEKALENMVGRVQSEDLELVVTAVLIQRQIGGNLSEILDNISDTIRQRVKIKREIKTMTSQGRMSGWIISLLPFVLVGIIMAVNPEQMSVLFTEPLGRAMIGTALALELIGILIVRKVVNIEV